MPNSIDSVEKIITRYFATLTKNPFTYDGKEYQPKRLSVSPMLLRGVNCPPGCGGCCRRFTLDWLPAERKKLREHGYDLTRLVDREIEFDGRKVKVISDLQGDSDSYWCRNLNPKDGRCGVHQFSPFSCDFELIRTLQSDTDDVPNRLTQQLFGRGWAMKRITDGQRGSMCSMTPVTPDTIASVVRRLNRFLDWTEHFGLETWIPDIIQLVESGRLARAGGPVTYGDNKVGFFK